MRDTLLKTAATISILFAFEFRALGQDFSKALPQVEKATVLIRASSDENSSSLGTGFFVDDKGLLVTNYHVIEDATSAILKLSNGTVTSVAQVVAIYPENDLAVLRADIKDNPFLKLSSQPAGKGSPVGALGNPKGMEFTFSTGVVSAYRKIEGIDCVQFTAPISSGSSGGPVFDLTGVVVGVATMSLKDSQNMNFAITSGKVAALLKSSELEPQKQWLNYDPFRDARIPTQFDMSLEAARSLEQLEALHQTIYDEVLLIYADDLPTRDAIRKTQRAWVTYKELTVVSLFPSHQESGTFGRGVAAPTHLRTLAKDRLQHLMKWRQGIEEGDLSAGAIYTKDKVASRERELGLESR